MLKARAAAMEPRRDDGDDRSRVLADVSADLPQWSPVVTTGTTRAVADAPGCAARPQWSPVVTTGTTRPSVGRRAGDSTAAMEPRRDDGDDT